MEIANIMKAQLPRRDIITLTVSFRLLVLVSVGSRVSEFESPSFSQPILSSSLDFGRGLNMNANRQLEDIRPPRITRPSFQSKLLINLKILQSMSSSYFYSFPIIFCFEMTYTRVRGAMMNVPRPEPQIVIPVTKGLHLSKYCVIQSILGR